MQHGISTDSLAKILNRKPERLRRLVSEGKIAVNKFGHAQVWLYEQAKAAAKILDVTDPAALLAVNELPTEADATMLIRISTPPSRQRAIHFSIASDDLPLDMPQSVFVRCPFCGGIMGFEVLAGDPIPKTATCNRWSCEKEFNVSENLRNSQEDNVAAQAAAKRFSEDRALQFSFGLDPWTDEKGFRQARLRYVAQQLGVTAIARHAQQR